jgi:8-oxo-dGTP diphosphatase
VKLEFSAGGIIYRQKQETIEFLLILDSYDKWTFPKGHIEKPESAEDAALREVTEETGLCPKIIKLLDKIDYWFKTPTLQSEPRHKASVRGGELIHKFVYFYLMEAPADSELSPQLTEIKEAKWFSPHRAKEMLGYRKDDLPLLLQALEELSLPED